MNTTYWRWLLLFSILTFLAACTAPTSEPRARMTLSEAFGDDARAGFERAVEVRSFAFPRDHGPHPSFGTEWWYYIGNLKAADGRHFGFQFTIFRFGLQPDEPERESDWATNQIYMAHFAVTDVAGQRFYAFERFSRGSAGLAGATAEPFRVWLENWSSTGLSAAGTPMRLQATEGEVAIDLTLALGKPPVLQGNQGLSQKSATIGNASYYYSLTRMPTEGTLTLRGEAIPVTGQSWMDREWGTSALGDEQVGWDWFALQLDDGRDLMFYQLRLKDGTIDPFSKGVLVAADGSSRFLARNEVQLTVLDTWRSPRDNVEYPSGWRLQVPNDGIDLTITPQVRDQELPVTIIYWEGSVKISGSATGYGYVELTGYADVVARNDGIQIR
jgi:predicted secreted hydrolase